MNKTEAYNAGHDRGFNIASWIDVPEIGTKLDKHIDWQGIDTIETEQDQKDAIQLYASEAESNDRQFSPFEFTAKEINDSKYADELWEQFDQGISDGILDNIASRFK